MNNSVVKSTGGVKSFKKSDYRRKVSLAAAKANKRIARLEKNGLTDSPAYKKLMENGGAKFGVKGKTFNEVQAEFSRINQFLNSETSTIRGIKRTVQTISKNTGIKGRNVRELMDNATVFFELAGRVEDYLRNVQDMASAVGYHRIWEVINEYVEEEGLDLEEAKGNIEEITKQITDIIDQTTGDSGRLYDIDPDDEDGWMVLL